jgi:DNA mismatch repair protein MutL
MSNRIRILKDNVANQIAAGEVIERPASVVKELVENSLDADATQIEIDIQKGGRSLIRITDNGFGMSYDDALLSLERHATSKIRDASDLNSISSYGFRGEAVPSIASVSKFKLTTCERGQHVGTEIEIEGGRMVQVKEAGCPEGTTIEIRSLFFNLPARRKFLRTEETEWGHIEQYVRLTALAKPQVGIILRHNGSVVYHFPPVTTLQERLQQVFGREWLKNVLPLDVQQNSFALRGVIGRPGISRSNRQEQILFVNNRPIQNNTLNYAIAEGYHNALMKGRYPLGVLFLEIDPAQVDVNVHPAKREVRFRNDFELRQFVSDAVRQTIQREESGEILEAKLQSPKTENLVPIEKPLLSSAPTFTLSKMEVEKKESFTLDAQPAAAVAGLDAQHLFPSIFQPRAFQQPSQELTKLVKDKHELNILGVVMNLYIIAENSSGIVIIDQHAAHERIMFEDLLKRLEKDEALSQRLLLPINMDFTPDQTAFIKTQLEALQKIGLGISPMGGNTFMIDALPPMVKSNKVEKYVRDFIEGLQQEGGETSKKRRLSEEVVVRLACRFAVKANDVLRPQEVTKLIEDLLDCNLPYTCPHGRPTMILISSNELEKKFGRIF